MPWNQLLLQSQIILLKPTDSRSAYERAWGREDSPEWYHEKDSSQEDRLDEAFSDAMGSMFGEGGLFGVDSPASNVNPTNYEKSEPSMDFSLFDDNPATPQLPQQQVSQLRPHILRQQQHLVQIDRYQVHR